MKKARYALSKKEKSKYIEELTGMLTVLRSMAGISQDELSICVGISRQTYGSVERKKCKMSWNTYLSLIAFYDYNKDTHEYIRKSDAFPHDILDKFNERDSSSDNKFNEFIDGMNDDILSALDEQAKSTIRAVTLVEYARCKPMSSEAMIKFFEGNKFPYKLVTKEDENLKKTIKKIKKGKK